METGHTPTPWTLSGGGLKDANGEAVNSHSSLVKQRDELLEAAKALLDQVGTNDLYSQGHIHPLSKALKAAIANAEKGA